MARRRGDGRCVALYARLSSKRCMQWERTMDSGYSAKVSPSVYTELKKSVKKNGHQPIVVPFICTSQKSVSKEACIAASFTFSYQKELKIKARPLSSISTGVT